MTGSALVKRLATLAGVNLFARFPIQFDWLLCAVGSAAIGQPALKTGWPRRPVGAREGQRWQQLEPNGSLASKLVEASRQAGEILRLRLVLVKVAWRRLVAVLRCPDCLQHRCSASSTARSAV